MLVLALVFAAGCGGGSETADASPSKAGADSATARALASLVIIDRDTSVRPVGTATYRGGNEGEGLAVGDSVQTSSTGFAEVAFFDGSLTRIDRSGEFTLTALSDVGAARQVKGSLVGGRAWNRVAKAAGSSDQFVIDTPVASASVRGTAFSIDCTTVDVCVFAVVEGVVEITPIGGSPVLVTAPAQLTVRRNTPPSAPVALDAAAVGADAWISKNLTRDTAAGKAPATTAAPTTTAATATTTTTESAATTVAPATTGRSAPASTTPAGPPPTDPPPTAPPTTAGLTLDLAGEWIASSEGYRVTQATGCAVGAVIRTIGPDLYSARSPESPFCGLGSFGGLAGIRPVLKCSGATCRGSGFVFTRTSATSIVTEPLKADCGFSPVEGPAQLSDDGRRLTVLQSFSSCSESFGVQVAFTVVLTRV